MAKNQDFSLNSCGLFARLDLNGFAWKTSQRSLLGDWEPFCGNWPKAGTMLNGVCLARTMWAHPIAENGSGSSPGKNLPTPSATDWKGSRKVGQRRGQLSEAEGIVGGKLNPAFVEWLMGFPIGWTA